MKSSRHRASTASSPGVSRAGQLLGGRVGHGGPTLQAARNSSDAKGTSGCGRRTGVRRGFTLIELLVVVAILAVLMSILLPSLKGAREQARAVTCGQKLRDLGIGLGTYFAENQDMIPGCNTSGVWIRAVIGIPGAMNNSRMPVQSYDWITPVICRSTAMQAVRAQRFKEILGRFHCPSQQLYRTTIFTQGYGYVQDLKDFLSDAKSDPSGWTAVSYLMPAHFQYWGTDLKGTVLTYHQANPDYAIKARTVNQYWEVVHPAFRSLLNQIGEPSRKIAAADGTRYMTALYTVDFDPSPDPNYFGAFTDAGAWWCGSTAYGVKSGSRNWSDRPVDAGLSDPEAQGRNLELSYRHGDRRGAGLSGSARENKGLINALFFDGSVQRLRDKQSRDPVYWYPKGAKVQETAEGMIDVLQIGDLIP